MNEFGLLFIVTVKIVLPEQENIPFYYSIRDYLQECPIAHAAGIPLFVKRLWNLKAKTHESNIIVRMMS